MFKQSQTRMLTGYFDDVFEDLFKVLPQNKLWKLTVENDLHVLSLDVPGCSADDVKLSLDTNTCVLTAEYLEGDKKHKNSCLISDYLLDPDSAVATCNNGRLKVSFKKVSDKKNVRQIKVGSF